MTAQSILLTDNYSSLFEQFVGRTLKALMTASQAEGETLSAATRHRALRTLDFALESVATQLGAVTLLAEIAPKMEQAGLREEWIPYLEMAVRLSRNQHDANHAGEFELQIGTLYRMMAKFDQALPWLTASRQDFLASGNRKGQARALNEIAWVEQLNNQFERAKEHVEQALAMIDKNDEIERAMSYRVQGAIADQEQRWKEAENFHRSALMLFERHKDRRKAAWCRQNLAYSLREQKRFEESISNYQRAAETLRQLGDDYHWSIVQVGLGHTYLNVGESTKAMACFRSAEKVALRLHDSLQLARIYTNLGLILMSLSDYAEAERSFRAAMDWYEALKDRGWYLNAVDGLAMTYLARQQYGDAIAVLTKAIAMLPEVTNTPNYHHLQQSLHEHLRQAQAAST
ncbi:MAG: tetratricopeptide repeat protein [Caldilineaceae bacterium]